MISGMRFVFAIMLCIANMIIYGLKVNMSTALLGMVKHTENHTFFHHDFRTINDGQSNPRTDDNDGDRYNWTSAEQNFIISVYFFGYLIGMFPAGYFADRFNTKMVLLFCVFFNALFTLMVPLVASHLFILYIIRFLTGLVSAANLPIVNVLVGKWVVSEEKSLWAAIIYSGTSLGTVLSILSTGWIIELSSWQMVFYIHGAVPFIWMLLFAVMFADCPEDQKWITEEEREKLVTSPGHRSPKSGEKKSVPWRDMFTSRPFIALLMTNTLGNFTWYLLLTLMPLYMANILHFQIKKNATLTCLPYLLSVITNPILGKLLDYGRRNEWWTQTGARKLAVAISCIPASIMLIIIAILTPDRDVTVVLLCASIVTSGAIFVGHLINQNDLAPNYAGILMGITNTPGTLSAFILPWLIGVLTNDGHTVQSWQIVFGVTIIAQMSAFLIFMIFGKAEIQPWNEPQ